LIKIILKRLGLTSLFLLSFFLSFLLVFLYFLEKIKVKMKKREASMVRGWRRCWFGEVDEISPFLFSFIFVLVKPNQINPPKEN